MKLYRNLWLGLMAGVAAVVTSVASSLGHPRHQHALVLTAIGLGLPLALGFAQGSVAKQNPVIAIDIALEPDATMVEHAMAANARLLKSFPKGFALVKTGTPAAFFSDEDGRDIQKSLIDYVASFVTIAAGKRFNPHVTIGVGTETYLNKMLAEPFASFTFSATGASVYQLGSFGTARKELKALSLTP